MIATSHKTVVCEPLHRCYRAAVAVVSPLESERYHRHFMQTLKAVSYKRVHQIIVQLPELRSVLTIPHDGNSLAEVVIQRPDRRERRERERKAEPMAGRIDVTTSECVDVM